MIIDIKFLAKALQEKLNNGIASASINNLIPNTRFEFHISTETGEYKMPHVDEDNPNLVVEYICGVMHALPGATNTGYSSRDYIGSIPVSIELLIPHCELEDPETGNSKMLTYVLDHIDNRLTLNQQFEETDIRAKPSVTYQITAAFSPPYASAREIRPEAGDSVVVTLQALYAVVANGLGPDNAKIAVSGEYLAVDSTKWENIYTTQLNLARATLTDGNIFNNDDSGSTKCTYTGSRLVITVNGAVRGSYLDTAMLGYISTGKIPIFYVRLTLRENVTVHKMTFLECEVAIQVPSIPGCAYSLVEVV